MNQRISQRANQRTSRSDARRKWALSAALAVALGVAVLLSLMAGRTWVPFDHWLTGDLPSLIIMELRLPRACVGALIGAGLGMA
ncbi:MAG: iron chelate uptake ABC transporter family permease subunit, partial [Sphingopyxis sp.]